MTFKGDKLLIKHPNKDLEGECEYKIDSKKSPKHFDMTPPKPDKPQLGIYELTAEEFKLCLGLEERPSDFASKAGSKSVLLIFKKYQARPLDDETKALQGVWIIQSIEKDGKAVSEEKVKDYPPLKFKGDKLVVENDDEVDYTIDPKTSPKRIDVFPYAWRPDQPKVLLGIYELKGDELKLCYSRGDRPTEFAGKADSKSASVFFVLKKKKP
jgi:uncharacterized protein (TIGR03067 family)